METRGGELEQHGDELSLDPAGFLSTNQEDGSESVSDELATWHSAPQGAHLAGMEAASRGPARSLGWEGCHMEEVKGHHCPPNGQDLGKGVLLSALIAPLYPHPASPRREGSSEAQSTFSPRESPTGNQPHFPEEETEA